jgi:hypothetical protein
MVPQLTLVAVVEAAHTFMLQTEVMDLLVLEVRVAVDQEENIVAAHNQELQAQQTPVVVAAAEQDLIRHHNLGQVVTEVRVL